MKLPGMSVNSSLVKFCIPNRLDNATHTEIRSQGCQSTVDCMLIENESLYVSKVNLTQGSKGKPHIEFEKDQTVELSVDKIDPKSVLPFICCFRLSS